MKVSVCLLLLVCLARGQGPNTKGGPPGPPPPEVSFSSLTKGGPSLPAEPTKPGAAPAENPWHSLLHRMMQLIQEAAPTSFPPTASSKGSSGQTASSTTYTDVPAGSGGAGPNAVDAYPAPSQNKPSVKEKAAEPYKAGPNAVDAYPGPNAVDAYPGPNAVDAYPGPNAVDAYPAPSQNNPSVKAKAAGPYTAVGPNAVNPNANLGQAPDIYAPVKQTLPPTTQKPTTQAPVVTQPPAPVITDCFFEGKYYRPSSDIVRGQHHKWCYVTYCDDQGRVQFWDDYNCKPNSMKPTSTHNTGIAGRSKTKPTPAPPVPVPGCDYNARKYELGQEIDTNQVGERCYGTYCNNKGQVIQWEDWCAPKTTPKPYRPPTSKKPRNQGHQRNGGQGPRNGGQGGPRNGGQGGPRNGGQGGPRNGGQGSGHGGGQGGGRGGGQGGGRGGGGGGGGQNKGKQGGGQGKWQNQGQGQGAAAAAPAKPHKPTQGCYHNNMYYKPNEDVVVGNIGDMCYGYYCEGDNTFVHWEDTCTPTTQGPNQPYY